MKHLGDEYRLSGDSIFDIVDRFQTEAARAARFRKFHGRERGRRVAAGPLLNAVVLHYLELDERERVELALRAIDRLEHYLAETDAEHARTDAATRAAAEAFAAMQPSADPRTAMGGSADTSSGERPKRAAKGAAKGSSRA